MAQEVITRQPAGLVEIESPDYVPTQTQGGFELLPYRERRNSWGGYVTFAAGNFAPSNYEPESFAELFEEVYPTTNYSFYEFAYSIKKNLALGALSLDLGVGQMTLDANKDFEGSKLELTSARVGATIVLDTLTREPYLVPFFGGGVYVVQYKETYDGVEFGGQTSAAMYYSAGLSAQLNWIDSQSSRDAYAEIGVENTFLVFEYRGYIASQNETDPDFSSTVMSLGFRLEH